MDIKIDKVVVTQRQNGRLQDRVVYLKQECTPEQLLDVFEDSWPSMQPGEALIYRFEKG